MGRRTRSDICRNVARLPRDVYLPQDWQSPCDDWSMLYESIEVGEKGRLFADFAIKLSGDTLFGCCAVNECEWASGGSYKMAVFQFVPGPQSTIGQELDLLNKEGTYVEAGLSKELAKILSKAKKELGRAAVEMLLADLNLHEIEISDSDSVQQTL